MESKKEIRSERIKIRLTKDQRNRLETQAAKTRVSLSAYMRSRLRQNKKLAPVAHLDMVRELRHSGARLKRIFDALSQSEMSPELDREYKKAMSELTEILERIATADH